MTIDHSAGRSMPTGRLQEPTMPQGDVPTATSMFRPARPRRAFDEIIGQIRALIENGELRPGDRLPSERVLAEQFAVSRNTVREALRMLEISGLVLLKRGATGGAFISRADSSVVTSSLTDALLLTDFSLADVTDATRRIATVVTVAACEVITDEGLAELEANVEEVAKLVKAAEWERKAQVNLEFQRLLARATGNPVLVIIMDSLIGVLREVIQNVGPRQDDFTLRSRRRLLKHLSARDADGAAAEIERYLDRLHALWLDDSTAEPETPHGGAAAAD
ncbi:FadR family transcriptional regulator [Actinomadura darangshiensis]|uniref:FadR family transcriptional regulator n=1 Tax=Actinomadura darangshiensis TaxID=705336 RepID=A0A4R5BPW0_9ACTN|nr:GntR family transcriptional regulator [Actinomadura darangshiensis]TDD87979.1 FadR family transcriptional regulator [Actinomadura darangshiensis]